MSQVQRPKLDLQTNIPVSITVQNYDSPRMGEGQYGKYFIYDVIHDGTEKVLFLNEKQYGAVNNKFLIKRGIVTICRSEKKFPDGGKVTVLEVIDGSTPEAAFVNDLNVSKNEQLVKDKKKIEDDRANGQAWGNAKTNAVNYANLLLEKNLIDITLWRITVEAEALWLYNLEPDGK